VRSSNRAARLALTLRCSTTVRGLFLVSSGNFLKHSFPKVSLTPPDELTETGRKLSEDAKKNGLKLVFPEENLVDRVWHDRPPRTHKQIYTHPLKFSGEKSSLTEHGKRREARPFSQSSTGKPAAEKVADLRAWLSDTYKCSSTSPNSPYYLLSALNPIAWFLNLRGGDIAFDPVFYAYVLVSRDKVRIWVQRQSLTKEVEQAIAELGGEIRDYQDAIKEVEEIVAAEEGNFLVTDATVSWAVVDRIGQVCSRTSFAWIVWPASQMK
jgi:Xaa-Pro aminopeptidase